MFNWLRNRVRAAVLSGINDAIDEIRRSDTVEDEPARLRLDAEAPAPTLPAAEEPARRSNGKKVTS